MAIHRETVPLPQASWLFTMVNPVGGITVKISFFPLNGPNHVGLFHPVCIDTHAFGHFLNLIKFHFTLPDFVFGLTVA
jgi:hypothetical protein